MAGGKRIRVEKWWEKTESCKLAEFKTVYTYVYTNIHIWYDFRN